MGRVMFACTDVHPLNAGQQFTSRASPGLQQLSMPGPSRASTLASPPDGIGARTAAADSASHAASLRPGHGGVPGRTSALTGRVCSEASARLKDKSRGNAGSAVTLNSARGEAQHSAAQHAFSAAYRAAANSKAEKPGRPRAPSWQEFIDNVDELGCDIRPEKQQHAQHSAQRAPTACTAECSIFATQYD